jgi:hypothetical protein
LRWIFRQASVAETRVKDHGTGLLERGHHRGIELRLATCVDRRAVFGRHVLGIDDVLDADGNAMQRPDAQTLPAPLIGPARLLESEVAVEVGPRLHDLLTFRDPLKAGRDQHLRRDFTRHDAPRGFGRGQLRQVGHGDVHQVDSVAAGPDRMQPSDARSVICRRLRTAAIERFRGRCRG